MWVHCKPSIFSYTYVHILLHGFFYWHKSDALVFHVTIEANHGLMIFFLRPQVAEKYKVGLPSTFHYLNQSKTYELDGISSAHEYLKTRRAMDIVGINLDDQVNEFNICFYFFRCLDRYGKPVFLFQITFDILVSFMLQEAIFRTLAGILHLGNIEFSPGNEHDSSAMKDTNSNFHLQIAANLFMCVACSCELITSRLVLCYLFFVQSFGSFYYLLITSICQFGHKVISYNVTYNYKICPFCQ